MRPVGRGGLHRPKLEGSISPRDLGQGNPLAVMTGTPVGHRALEAPVRQRPEMPVGVVPVEGQIGQDRARGHRPKPVGPLLAPRRQSSTHNRWTRQRAHGLDVTALNHHFFFDEPKIYFVQYWATGSVEGLAKSFKAEPDAQAAVRNADTSRR